MNMAALSQGVAVFVLLLFRMAPLGWLVPWTSARAGAPLLALTSSVVLSTCLWTVAAAGAPALPLVPMPLLALCLRELLIGVVYALALALPLRALEWAGWLQGRFSGIPGAERAYASLQSWLGLAAFFTLGGHRLALSALADGLSRHPIGALASPGSLGAVALGSARLLGDAFAAAVQIALPVGAAIGIAELGLGLVARVAAAPGFQLALAPARAALAMFVVWIASALWLGSSSSYFQRGFAAAKRLWEAL
jgi:flagellar biosynthesis protein FliR